MNEDRSETREVRDGSAYAGAWRWHFYAAFLVIPFVLLQATTGAIYLFNPEIDPIGHSEKYYVDPVGEPVSYDEQLKTVREQFPGRTVARADIYPDSQRSTAFLFRDEKAGPVTAYVDPYSGAYLGSIEEKKRPTELMKRVHGTLFMGSPGSFIVELGASWTLVMIVTGIYLWWPRGRFHFLGTLIPRFGARGRIFWKDLHKAAGIWFAVFVVGFIVTGLPWALILGETLLAGFQRAIGQTSPGFVALQPPHHEHGNSHEPGISHTANASDKKQTIPLQKVVDYAKAKGTGNPIRISLPQGRPEGVYTVMKMAARTWDRHAVALDRYTGEVVGKKEWSDKPIIPKIVATGVDLHEGRFFGRANQIINLIVAMSLIFMAMTGFVMWWKRRPKGKLAAPPKPSWKRWPSQVSVIACILAVLLPTVGLSILGFLVFDRIIAKRISWLRATAT